jgi:hypothetical protein
MWIYILLGVAGLIYSLTRRMWQGEPRRTVEYPDDITQLTDEMLINVAQIDTSPLTSHYDGLKWLLEESNPNKQILYSSLNFILPGLEDHLRRRLHYPYLPVCVLLGLSQLSHLAKLQGFDQSYLDGVVTKVVLFLGSLDERVDGPTEMDLAVQKIMPMIDGYSLESQATLQLYIEISFLDAVLPDGAAGLREEYAGLPNKVGVGDFLSEIVKIMERTSRLIEQYLE